MATVGDISKEKLDKFKFMIGEQVIDIDVKANKDKPVDRELNDTLTQFITQHFFSEEKTLTKFIKLITTTFDRELAKYTKDHGLDPKSIIFIYKGGNILKFYMSFAMHQYPSSMSDVLSNFYSPHFKRSDADFSVYIDPRIPNYKTVFADIKKLTYMILSAIKKEFAANMKDYFDIFNLNADKQQKLLRELLENMKALPVNSHGIKNIGFDNNAGIRQDFIIRKDPASQNTLVNLLKNDESKHALYVSVNEALSFMKNNHLTEFNLIRMKMCMHGIVENNVSRLIYGEVIDVTLPTEKDYGLNKLYTTEKTDDVFTRIHFEDNDFNFSFNTYSIYYLIKDLEKMLFYDNEYPWEDLKYSKRINRLMFLYFADLLDNRKGVMPIEIQKKVLELQSALNSLKNNFNPDEKAKFQAVIKTNTDYFKKYNYYIQNLLIAMQRLLNNQNINKEEMIKFINVVLDNINVYVNAFNGLFTYLKNNGKAPTNPQTVDFMGGSLDKNGYNKFYEDKYLSYKQKYLELKSLMRKN